MDIRDLKKLKWNGLIQSGNGTDPYENTNFNFHKFYLTINITDEKISDLLAGEYFSTLHTRTKNKIISVVKRCIASTIYYGIHTPIYMIVHHKSKNSSLYNLSKVCVNEHRTMKKLVYCGFLSINIGKRVWDDSKRVFKNIPTSYFITKKYISVLSSSNLLDKNIIRSDYSFGYLGKSVIVNSGKYNNRKKFVVEYDDLDTKSKRKHTQMCKNITKLQLKLDKISMNYTLLYKKRDGSYSEFYKVSGKHPILLNTAFHVRRIFALNKYISGKSVCDFNSHGRFYNGISNIESIVRKRRLFIMDNKTKEIFKMSELDFPSCFAHLAYSMVGINLQECGIPDAYHIPWVTSASNGYLDAGRTRTVVKKVFVILFNTDKKSDIWKILSNLDVDGIKFTDKYKVTESDIKQIISEIFECHAPIADLFLSKSGLKLMYKESQIARDIYEYFAGNGVPIIGIHDSFMVPENKIDDLERYMFDKLGVRPVLC